MTEAYQQTPPEGQETLTVPIAATIRFHHFENPVVRESLLGFATPDRIEWYVGEVNFDDDYHRDVFGEGTEEELSYVTRTISAYSKLLAGLPDDSWIKLTKQPDPMCESCVIGKHCTADNYIDPLRQEISTIRGENHAAIEIEDKLLQNLPFKS
ncbi:MAG TPA: hypothetical protein VHE53_05575 [Patescibacteria group bacterium]|nr:hypothetical protein [Patescibacteria group bacterium]